MNKKSLLILLFVLLLLSKPLLTSARDLETPYPSLPGVITPTTTEEPIILYLLYIYQLSIAASGFIIFIMFIIGGWKYLFSVGNPSKMLDGRKRMQSALLGFVIVLGSYMILNTISSGFIVFPDLILEDVDLGDVQQSVLENFLAEQYLKELPLGALITSEYTASVFLEDATPTDPKIDIDDPESYKSYVAAFPKMKEYNSDFQGALHGRRLKRILEVASSTNSMATVMESIAQDIGKSVSYAENRLNLLATLAATCSCSKCRNLLCTDPIALICPCFLCNNGLYPCGVVERKIMKHIQDEVPKLYEGYESESPTSIIPCKTLELEYASKILLNFAVDDKYINSDKDTSDNSFVGSQEEEDMKKALEQCHGQDWNQNFGISDTKIQEKLSSILNQITSAISNALSNILDTKDTSTRDSLYNNLNNKYSDDINNFLKEKDKDASISTSTTEIEKRRDILAVTENSGNWDPTSTIPERDVVTNLNDLQVIYNSLLDVKKIMNPYDIEFQSTELMTYMQLEATKASIQVFDPDQMPTSIKDEGKIIVFPYKVLFANSLSSISEKEIMKYSEDPATFYYENPDYLQSEVKKNSPLINLFSQLFNFKVNIANAEEDEVSNDTGGLTEGLSDEEKTQCAPLVEIPIGDATDEALNLTKDILDQLKTMKDNIVSMPQKIKSLKQNQKDFYEAADNLIEKTEECKNSCLGSCSCTCGVPVMIPCPTTGLCCGSCNCTCMSIVGEICPGLKSAIVEFEKAAMIMNITFNDISDDIEEIIVAFKRLNSEDIKEDKDKNVEGTKDHEYLGTNICCIDKEGDGNCRNEKNDGYVNTEERKYTLKEQLVRVQLLLNRSREIGYSSSESDDNKSDYAILLKGLDDLKDDRYSNMAYRTNDFLISGGTTPTTDPSLAPIYGYSYETYETTESGEIINTTEVPLENRYLSDLSDCGYIYEDVEQLEEDQRKHSLALLLDSELAKGEFLDDFTKLLDPNISESCTPDPLLDCYYYVKYMKKDAIEDVKTPKRDRIPFHCYFYIKDLKYLNLPTGTRTPEGGNLANNMYCCIVPYQPEKEL